MHESKISEPSKSIGALLHQTTFACRKLVNHRLDPLGLSQAKWRALLNLSKAGKPLTQCELAMALEIEPPTLVRLLDRLMREGWVERRKGHDRRVKYIHLTQQAEDILVKIQMTVNQVQKELLADISEEDIANCVMVLEKIKHQAEQSYG